MADVVSSYFDLFIKAARQPDIKGQPTAEQLEDVGNQLSADCEYELRGLILSAMDVVLGWDLIYGEYDDLDPEKAYTDAFVGHIADEKATPLIIEATKEAFVNAILQENPEAVVPSLTAFWETYPDYQPAHTGRCYPHGHSLYDTALDCQIAQFKSMLSALLEARKNPVLDFI
ncbi:MAG: hypothetical protein O6944_07955 [Gammaproteobacteria bacterium]|nr:hypothetical protein [Gammaproteobacteria bacterium]